MADRNMFVVVVFFSSFSFFVLYFVYCTSDADHLLSFGDFLICGWTKRHFILLYYIYVGILWCLSGHLMIWESMIAVIFNGLAWW